MKAVYEVLWAATGCLIPWASLAGVQRGAHCNCGPNLLGVCWLEITAVQHGYGLMAHHKPCIWQQVAIEARPL